MQAAAVPRVGYCGRLADVVVGHGDIGQGDAAVSVLNAAASTVGYVCSDGGVSHHQNIQVEDTATGAGRAVGDIVGHGCAVSHRQGAGVVEQAAAAVVSCVT